MSAWDSLPSIVKRFAIGDTIKSTETEQRRQSKKLRLIIISPYTPAKHSIQRRHYNALQSI